MIFNYMELLVDDSLKTMLATRSDYQSICQCEHCIDDIKAKALNNLPPFYVTGKKGEVYGEYKKSNKDEYTNIIIEVVKAIEFVSANTTCNTKETPQ